MKYHEAYRTENIYLVLIRLNSGRKMSYLVLEKGLELLH